MDYGKDFYATQSYEHVPQSDGRRLWIAWMSNWEYANDEPTSPWRGVQSLPRELALRRTPDGIRLVQAPIRELATLRATREPVPVATSAALPGGAEIELEVEAGDWSEAGFRLSNSAGEEVIVGVRAQPLEVFVDRQRSRATPFHDEYPGRHAAPARWSNGRVALRAIFDRTTLEVFANGGEIVLSERVYPTRPFDRIEPLNASRGLVSPIRMWTVK